MKIHSLVEIDVATDKVLRDEWTEYNGPVILLKTKSTTEVPPPSAAENRLADVGAQLGEEQLRQIQKQSQFQDQFNEFSNPLMQSLFQSLGISDPNQSLFQGGSTDGRMFLGGSQNSVESPNQINQLPSSFQRSGTSSPIDELTQLQLGQVRNAGQASDVETNLINKAVDMALASGNSDINTAFQESLDILKQNLAPSLGLRPGDTPILDRGGKLALEASRQKSQLSNTLRGQQANQLLQFPLQRGQAISSQAGSLQNFLQSLEQQSFSNRAQLLGSIQGGGLGLAGLGGAGNTLGALTAGRTANSSTNTSDPFRTAAGVGSLAYLFGGSSKEYKNRVGSVDVFDVLESLKKLTIHKWQYKGDTVNHLGPYAEDFQELFGVGDGKTIHLIDVMGVALASLKAMALQMEKENGKAV